MLTIFIPPVKAGDELGSGGGAIADPLFLNDMASSVGAFLARRSPILLLKPAGTPNQAKSGGRGKLYEKQKRSVPRMFPISD